MQIADKKDLRIVEQELCFIAHQSQQIDGSPDIVGEINYAVISALRALEEYKLDLGQEREDSPKTSSWPHK